jgi:hypothetical protein
MADNIILPWETRCADNYTKVASVKAYQSNHAEVAAKPEVGITLGYQPTVSVDLDIAPGQRQALRRKPDLYAPSHPVVIALTKALPYVAGASGNINIMAHTIAHLKSRSVPIDAKYALLSTMMALHSGHSLHESLWVINLLGPKLNLGIDLGNHPPDSFVSDYDRFIELFQDADGKEKMEAARDSAWKTVTAYFREHSAYANAAASTGKDAEA